MITGRCVINMKGSRLAYEIEEDLKREEAFKKKAIRQKCIVDNKKQCNICGYRDICENIEVSNEI